MSPWLRSRLLVMLAPYELRLLPVQHPLGPRELGRAAGEPRTLACSQPGDGAAWLRALQVLEAALSELPARRPAITVVLSNHFVRYAIVPWRDELAPGDEELTWARHCFTRLYGSAAAQWEIRLDSLPRRCARLACAVDAEMMAALRALCARCGCMLRSVQPYLMAAFNSSRAQFGQCNAWLALPEPGHLCLAWLDQGEWLRLRGLRIERSWQAELPQLLEREAYLSENTSVPRDVYVWGLRADDVDLPQWGSWRPQALAPNRLAMGE